MEDLDRYLVEIVDPIVKEFEDNADSRRHAFIACVAVFHAIDYLAYPRSSRTLRETFRRESSDFGIVDEVAHAFKHVETGNPNNRLNVESVFAHKGDFSNDFSDDFDISKVTVKGRPGVDLLTNVRRTVKYLREYRPSIRPRRGAPPAAQPPRPPTQG